MLHRLGERQRVTPDPLAECFAFQVLHHQEVGPVLGADVVQGADVGMVQSGDRLGFALEPLAQVGIRADMVRQHFDGHRAVEAGVDRLVDLAHAAGADGRLDLVGAEPLPWGKWHRSPVTLCAREN